MTTSRDALISAGDNQKMFDSIASRYDWMNRAMSQGLDRSWRRRAVAELLPLAGEWYLDMGAGTADVGLEVLARCSGARVAGVDAAMEMLVVGRDKINRAELSSAITLQRGDALALPYRTAVFAGGISAFALRNLEDRARGLAEMSRTVKPGGRIVILELTRPGNAIMRGGHWLYNHTIVPILGRFFTRGDAYRYLARSIDDFPASASIIAKMQTAGLMNVRAIPLNGGIVTLFLGDVK